MRFVFAIFIFLISCSQKSNLTEELPAKHWFVQAKNWEQDRTATFSQDSLSHFDWDVVFYKDGRMFYASTFPFNFTDANGIQHIKGERFADSLYKYEIKADVIKVSKEDETYFLKFKKLDTDKYTITPATEEDFD